MPIHLKERGCYREKDAWKQVALRLYGQQSCIIAVLLPSSKDLPTVVNHFNDDDDHKRENYKLCLLKRCVHFGTVQSEKGQPCVLSVTKQ